MKPIINSRIDLKRIGDEFFAYSKKNKEAYKLDPLAFFIATLCDGTHTPEDIADRVTEVLEQNGFKPPAPPDRLSRKVEVVINMLSTKGIVLLSE